MSLNAYEIRLELVKLAKDGLYEKVQSRRQALSEEYFSNKELYQNLQYPELPDYPTTEEIIAEAKKLNDFVSNNPVS
jgi:hypothetical protein